VFVNLNRGQVFPNMKSIQDELSPFMLLLALDKGKVTKHTIQSWPKDRVQYDDVMRVVQGKPIPFITVDDSLGQRNIIAERTSTLNGNMVALFMSLNALHHHHPPHPHVGWY
jgi:hypothetical protein